MTAKELRDALAEVGDDVPVYDAAEAPLLGVTTARDQETGAVVVLLLFPEVGFEDASEEPPIETAVQELEQALVEPESKPKPRPKAKRPPTPRKK